MKVLVLLLNNGYYIFKVSILHVVVKGGNDNTEGQLLIFVDLILVLVVRLLFFEKGILFLKIFKRFEFHGIRSLNWRYRVKLGIRIVIFLIWLIIILYFLSHLLFFFVIFDFQ